MEHDRCFYIRKGLQQNQVRGLRAHQHSALHLARTTHPALALILNWLLLAGLAHLFLGLHALGAHVICTGKPKELAALQMGVWAVCLCLTPILTGQAIHARHPDGVPLIPNVPNWPCALQLIYLTAAYWPWALQPMFEACFILS